MKKTKAIVSIIVVTIISMLLPLYVNAHEVEIDPEEYITMPIILAEGVGTIGVDRVEGAYTLSYQAVLVPEDDATEIENTREQVTAELKTLNEQLNALDSERNTLREAMNTAYDEYMALVDSEAEPSEIEAAEAAYKEAETAYNNKSDEYDAKMQEFDSKEEEIIKKVYELTPMYVDENWIETTDGSVKIDITNFSGEKTFVLWAKLETVDGNIYYDEDIYGLEGLAEDTIKVESITLDRTSITMEKGDTYTLNARIEPSNADNKAVNWTSNNENVATVENGKITAVSAGTAIIRVETQDGGYTAECQVTVEEGTTVPKDDTTVPDTKLPQTGEISYIILGIVLTSGIVAIVLYVKNRRMKF